MVSTYPAASDKALQLIVAELVVKELAATPLGVLVVISSIQK
jgi:hypothetical protein